MYDPFILPIPIVGLAWPKTGENKAAFRPLSFTCVCQEPFRLVCKLALGHTHTIALYSLPLTMPHTIYKFVAAGLDLEWDRNNPCAALGQLLFLYCPVPLKVRGKPWPSSPDALALRSLLDVKLGWRWPADSQHIRGRIYLAPLEGDPEQEGCPFHRGSQRGFVWAVDAPCLHRFISDLVTSSSPPGYLLELIQWRGPCGT